MLDEKTKELVAIGATITVNCQPCLEYHTGKARELGATPAEILAAVAAGKEVRAGAAAKMDRFAAGFLGSAPPAAKTGGCCGG
jgi:AhpD family alkylhydroperoxidase